MKKARRSKKTNPRGKDAKVIQVNLDKYTAQAVEEAAAHDGRSVSNWVGRILEKEMMRATEDTATGYGQERSKRPTPHPMREPPPNAGAA